MSEHASGISATSLSIPSSTPVFQVKKAGAVKLDIIPYNVTKGKDTAGGNPYAEEGDLHFERTYFVHGNIGPENSRYCCLSKTFKQPCPICEFRAKMARDSEADEQLIKDLAPKERQLWNIIDLNNTEKGVQLFELSFHLFGRLLDELIKSAEENEYDMFADLEQGLSLRITFTEEKMRGVPFYKATVIEMKPRKKGYDESILEQSFDLDLIPRMMKYAELKDIFLQTGNNTDEDEDEEDDTPKKPGKPKPSKDEEEDEEGDEDQLASELGFKVGMAVDHEKLGPCTITHISGDGTSLRLEDEEGDEHRAIRPGDCEIIEVEEEAPPKKKPGKPAKVPPKKPKPTPKEEEDEEEDDGDGDSDEDDDEDEAEDDEDDEPPPKKPTSKKPAPKAPKPAPKKPGKKSKDEDEEEEEDDDEWED